MQTERITRFCLAWFVAGSGIVSWQTALCDEERPEFVTVAESPSVISPPVQFLEHSPTIDGILDASLTDLSIRKFTRFIQEECEGTPADARYRLAYGTDFLYVYVEAAADSLIFRDRAFQMGDGFHMVLAKPRPENAPTDEFYVLACSAVNQPRMEWTRRTFWYYNAHDIFVPTGDDTRLEFHDGDGAISFELLLPWRDVHPYHPWISEGIGFNMRFVKAIGQEGRLRYDVVHDDCIGCELHPRQYALLQFEEPALAGPPQTFASTDRGHIFEGGRLGMTAVTAAASAGEGSLTVLVLAGEGDAVAYEQTEYTFNPGLSTHMFEVNTAPQISGGYHIQWQYDSDEPGGETGLSILPLTDFDAVRSRLAAASADLKPGTLSTLEFKLEDVVAQIDSTKPYETCLRPRFRLARLQRQIDEALAGIDLYAGKTGFIRKAYRSELDGTLQSYMIRIPEDFDPELTYPLFVYLHGSASTEYNLMGAQKMIPGGFIALAPRGRGTSNCYTFDHAQEDIAEAIAAVIVDYPIDTSKIILGGFSMGGYGVYRTFYETPGKFRGLAIFSGHPNIANAWYPGNDYPDFTDPELLTLFRDVPIFVFHGERDRNAPFKRTETLVTRLRQLGGQVEFYREADKGHEEPGKDTFDAYYEWIRNTIQGSAGR